MVKDEYSEHTWFDRFGVAVGILVFMILMTSGGFAYTGCWNGTAGAIFAWTFDNTDTSGGVTADVCGSIIENNNGTIQGAATGYAGIFGESFYYDGVDDVVYNITATKVQFAENQDFSFNVWANTSKDLGGNTFVAGYADSNINPAMLTWWTANEFSYARSIDNAGAIAQFTDNQDLNGNWSMNTVVYFGANNTIQLYVDGVLRGSNQNLGMAGNLYGATNRLSTGAHWGSGSVQWLKDWEGSIDEFSWYNYSITQNDVDLLFTQNSVIDTLCTVQFTPISAGINLSTIFTGTRSGGCAAFDGNYYWNFTNSTGTLQTGNSNPTTQTFTNDGQWIGVFTATIGGVNVTKTQNITVAIKPNANFTISTAVANRWPGYSIQFNDTSSDSNIPTSNITTWYWDFGDGNTTSGSSIKNGTNVYLYPGEYEVGLIVVNAFGLNSTEYSQNVTINGFALGVFDESTLGAIINWNVTISNSTYVVNFTTQNNTFAWSNLTNFPTGDISIFIEAAGYVPRYYYGNFSLGSYINLDAYLLDAASGVYTTYYVRDKGTLAGIQDALIGWSRFLGGSWVTVEQRYTDSIGTALSYLSPYHNYRLTVSHPSYITYASNSYLPTSTTVIIYLNSSTTSTNLVNRSDYLYVDISPYELVISNGTSVTMTINAPDGNLLHYALWINYSNGTNAWNQVVAGSPSGGQIEFNTSGVAGLVSSSSDPFYAIARFNTGSGNETSVRTYYIDGIYTNTSMASGMSAAKSAYGTQTLVVLGILILMFVVGTASRFGYGSSVAGYLVVGGLMYFEWFPSTMVEIPILAVVGSIFVLASRRLD